jgi:hypothetical protein
MAAAIDKNNKLGLLHDASLPNLRGDWNVLSSAKAGLNSMEHW